MPDILVITAHPHKEQSRTHRALMDAAAQAASASGPLKIEVRDLYALYPDYLIDIPAEQALLKGVKLLVRHHPRSSGTTCHL